MSLSHQFVRVDFSRFKAFDSFRLDMRHFNIMVGPNNSGKSTILAAFRILAAGMRIANRRKPVMVDGPKGRRHGYAIDIDTISVAEENIFYNYDDSQPASVSFRLSNGNSLTLRFPKAGVCNLIADDPTKRIPTPALFRSRFNCPIGFVPILGPVEHNERLYEREAARLALFNYRAARNFRNIWHHYPEKFDTLRDTLRRTWPGMDIERPVVDLSHPKPVLHMFCPEERIPREMFWAGFGFQVWCQMLTHLVQSSDVSLFLIDEPDIYLHSDLQRQLLALLRNLGPDILLATHSTEIVTEAEPDEIVLIDKRKERDARLAHEPPPPRGQPGARLAHGAGQEPPLDLRVPRAWESGARSTRHGPCPPLVRGGLVREARALARGAAERCGPPCTLPGAHLCPRRRCTASAQPPERLIPLRRHAPARPEVCPRPEPATSRRLGRVTSTLPQPDPRPAATIGACPAAPAHRDEPAGGRSDLHHRSRWEIRAQGAGPVHPRVPGGVVARSDRRRAAASLLPDAA